MAWLKIDDRVRTHPKIIEAGPVASWLWLCGLTYCHEQMTDGSIPYRVVKLLAIGIGRPTVHVRKLLRIGLWIDTGSHYQVHDYLDWNPSRAEIIAQRKRDLDRKRPEVTQPDSAPIPSGIPADSDRKNNGIHTPRARAGAGSDLYLGSKELDLSEEKSAKEETTALAVVAATGGWVVPHGNPHANPLNLVNGADARSHGSHAWCAPGRPSLCVLQKQHGEIMGALQRSDAETRVFYARALAKYDGQPIGDNRFKFWENEIAAEVGTVTSSPPQFQTKGNGTAAAFNRFAAAVKAGRV